jgi:tRNA pseudouridine32 synthase/23S rRNA pseudouridine746 synthase
MSNKLGTKNGVGPSRVFLPAGSYPSLLDFLVERFPASTREGWTRRMTEGTVLDQAGEPLRPQAAYLPNQHIYYYRELQKETPIPFEEIVVYEDDNIVVVDKPHFLPVSPVGPFVQETLLVRLRNRLGIDGLNLAHRIDLETAGLVLFTKRPELRATYQNLFRDQKIDKYYEAIAPIKLDLELPLTYKSCLEESPAFMQMHEKQGEPNSETRIELIDAKDGLGRYKLSPVTGKKHQLRAHMNALGIPIKNDQIYPVLKEYVHPETRNYSEPLQLLAKELSFIDPLTHKEHVFKSTLSLLPLDKSSFSD